MRSSSIRATVATLFHLALCKASLRRDADALDLMARAHAVNPAELAQFARPSVYHFDALVAAIERLHHHAKTREIYDRYCTQKELVVQVVGVLAWTRSFENRACGKCGKSAWLTQTGLVVVVNLHSTN